MESLSGKYRQCLQAVRERSEKRVDKTDVEGIADLAKRVQGESTNLELSKDLFGKAIDMLVEKNTQALSELENKLKSFDDYQFDKSKFNFYKCTGSWCKNNQLHELEIALERFEKDRRIKEELQKQSDRELNVRRMARETRIIAKQRRQEHQRQKELAREAERLAAARREHLAREDQRLDAERLKQRKQKVKTKYKEKSVRSNQTSHNIIGIWAGGRPGYRLYRDFRSDGTVGLYQEQWGTKPRYDNHWRRSGNKILFTARYIGSQVCEISVKKEEFIEQCYSADHPQDYNTIEYKYLYRAWLNGDRSVIRESYEQIRYRRADKPW